MKKLIYIVLALISTVFFTQAAFAKEADKANYVSMQKPAGESVAASSTYYPYEISITNYSSRYIDIYVPVLNFSSRLLPYYTQYVYSYAPEAKRVILYDYMGYIFFDFPVSNGTSIEAFDRLGKLEAQVK